MARILQWVRYWKVEKTPSKQDLLEKFLETAEMDILTMILKDKEDQKIRDIWKLIYEWIKTVD